MSTYVRYPTSSASNGIPAGGTSGQVLAKTSNADYAVGWVAGGSGSGNVNNGGNAFSGTMSVGTTDAYSFAFLSNNVQRAIVDLNGYWGFNTNPQSDASSSNRFYFYASSIGSGVQKNFTGLFSEVMLSNTSDGSGYQEGIYVSVHSEHATGTYALLRNYFMAEHAGNGVITETYGARTLTRLFDKNYPSTVSSGTIQNAYGLEAYANNTSTGGGIIQNATGIVITHAKATGTDGGNPHIARGLWIQNDISATGGSTNAAWSIDNQSTAESRWYGNLRLENGTALKLLGPSNINAISLVAPSGMGASVTYTLPGTDGTSGQFLKTNGAGVLSWATGGGGGGGVNYGGDTFASDQYIGSNNAYKFSLATNGTARLNIASTGEVTVGGNPGDFSSTPQQFGVTKFSTTDPFSNKPFNVFDQAFAYYGNSSTSFDGTLYQLALRPGETYFTYGGEFNTLVAKGFVSQPGAVGTLNGLKAQVDVPNGSGVLTYGTGAIFSVTASGGKVTKATGLRFEYVNCNNSGTTNEAVGIDIGSISVSATNGATNAAIGIRINNTLTGDSGSKYAIKSDSVEKSTFMGAVAVGTTSPAATAALDVTSTTQGILFPRMTTTQKNAISSPPSGLVVYDTTLGKLCVRGAAAWETITSV